VTDEVQTAETAADDDDALGHESLATACTRSSSSR
jgi:hypothetical protein